MSDMTGRWTALSYRNAISSLVLVKSRKKKIAFRRNFALISDVTLDCTYVPWRMVLLRFEQVY